MEWLAELKNLGLVVLACLLAAAVGYERETHGKPAGLRTHMIISGAAALLVVCGKWLVEGGVMAGPEPAMRYDPIRIIQAVIVGVSFIGAGTVLKVTHGNKADRVKYLTTAASLLFSAGIGICVAIERYIIAVGVALLILAINRAVGHFEHKHMG